MWGKWITAKAFALTMLLAPASFAAELIMVEQPGCHYCAEWNRKIGPIYPKTDEGRVAPLTRAHIRHGAPDGVTYARGVIFTPTFILVGDDGHEVARIEGYPGEDFFWGLLGMLMEEHLGYTQGGS